MKSTTKRWLLPILTILLTVCLAIGVGACNKGGGKSDDDKKDDDLAAPVIELDDETGIISWSAVENADRYIVYEDGEQATTTSDTQYNIKQNQKVEGTYEYTVASYNLSSRQTSEKSNSVTYTVKKDDGGDSHEHVWEYTDMNEQQHLKTCKVTGCTESSLENHNYTDDHDNECNDCGHVRSHQHSFEYEQEDENGHYKTCTTCDEIDHEFEEHVYDNPADEECNYCGYKRTITTNDKYVTLGVGAVETVIPAAGASLHVTFGNDVRADKIYVLEFVSDTYGAFYQTNVEVKLGSATIATFTNGVSDPEKIVLDGFNLSQSLVITQEGDEEIEITLTLAEQVKTGDYTLEKDGEMLTIDVGAGVASLNVAFGNWVTNGKKYDLEFSSIVGDYDIYFTIYLEYYEGGTLKTAEYDPDQTKTMTITADTSHGLRVYFKTNGTVQSVSIKLTTFVEKPAVPGETKSNPIIKTTVAGTHSTTELQEAYFRLPAIEFDDKYKITFADTEGVEVKIVNGSDQVAVWSGDVLNREQLGSKPASTYNYFLVTAPEGILCSFTLESYEEAEEYDLRVGIIVYAEIGKDATKAAKFNLINADNADYDINISTQSGLTFYVKVGSTTYTLGTNEYKSGTYSKTITIGNEEFLTIYVTGLDSSEKSIGNVAVSLTEPENTSPLEIDKEYKTVFKAGQYDSNMNFEIALKDVPKDKYIITFTLTSNTYTIFVVTPDKGVAGEIGTGSSYRQAQGKLVIDEGCTKLTVSLKENQAPGFTFNVTILLEVDPDKTQVLNLNESVEISIPYSTGSEAVRVDFGNTVKELTKYKISVSVPNDNGELSIYGYTSESEISKGGVKLDYNSRTGKYETKQIENVTGSFYLKHTSESNPVALDNVTVSLTEPGFGIGDYLETSKIGNGAQISTGTYKVTLDEDIEDGTELILTVTPKTNTSAKLYVSTDGSTLSTDTALYERVDGSFTIEFAKSGNLIQMKTSAGYFHATLSLTTKDGEGGGGEEEDVDTTGFIYKHEAGTLKTDANGGITYRISLSDANLPGAGEYTFKVVVGFSLTYTTGAKVTPQGGSPVSIGGGDLHSSAEVKLHLSGKCSYVTFEMEMSNMYGQSASFTFYLLGKDTTEGGGEGGGDEGGGGSSTYLFGTATVGGWGSPVEFDVSSLAYGEYRIYIAFADPIFADSSQPVFVTCNSTQDDFADLQARAGWTSGLIINGPTLYIYGFANVGQTISIEIEK